jgi:hypothetical protein
MSKTDPELPERLRSAGATQLEQRLLQAAGSELPSRELSERMARAIGVSLPAGGLAPGGAAKASAAKSKAATASSSLVPWVSGALLAAVVAGAFVATRPGGAPAPVSASAAPASSALGASTSLAAPVLSPALAEPSAKAESEDSAKAPTASATPRGRGGTTASELAAQIALVDAARAALASGDAPRALAGVHDYQADYPNGTFKPEVAAIKIEALVKLGRKTEARALAERFAKSYGPGPLADRVARLASVPQP